MPATSTPSKLGASAMPETATATSTVFVAESSEASVAVTETFRTNRQMNPPAP